MKNEIGIAQHDNVYFSIQCSTDQAHQLKEHFSCFVPNYQFTPKYKAKMWDGKIYFFNTVQRLLPIGLLSFLKPFLVKFGYKAKFLFPYKEKYTDTISQEALGAFYSRVFAGSDIRPRDYQETAILAGLERKRGILESATGSGKSLIIYCLIRYIMENTKGNILLIVPSINLVNQMFSDMKEYGWEDIDSDVSLLFGKNKNKVDFTKKVLISTWQSIHKKTAPFFSKYSAVLVDETHGAKSASLQKILQKCVHAEYRIGLTGTLPNEKVDRYNIFGYLGPVIFKLKSNELIERGFLTDLRIINTFVKYPEDDIVLNKERSYAEELGFIINNEERMGVISHIFEQTTSKGHKVVKDSHNVLVLAQRIQHIEDIVAYMKEKYPEREILSISGQTKPAERERIRKYVEETDGIVLVATYGTLSTGVNIPKLHHVIFASFYKSKIKVLQSIGRGLRKHDTKSIIYVWDIVNDMRWKKQKRANSVNEWGYNYAYSHFLERLEYYKDQKFKSVDNFYSIE